MIEYEARPVRNINTKEVRYYPGVALSGTMNIAAVATEIEKRSTVSSADVKAVLDALQFEVKQALADGHTVRLGDLGSFRLTVAAAYGSDEKENVTARYISHVRVRFTPSTQLQAEFATVGQTGSRVKVQRKSVSSTINDDSDQSEG